MPDRIFDNMLQPVTLVVIAGALGARLYIVAQITVCNVIVVQALCQTGDVLV